MKFFPKNAKTKKFSKTPYKKTVRSDPEIVAANLHDGFDFRQEFDLMATSMYKRLSPENKKKLWLVASSIIIKNIGSSMNLKSQLKLAIEQAHKILFKK
jgi:hypothetical protein